jgi:hypothetical protein
MVSEYQPDLIFDPVIIQQCPCYMISMEDRYAQAAEDLSGDRLTAANISGEADS